jgi:hypothetical protein
MLNCTNGLVVSAGFFSFVVLLQGTTSLAAPTDFLTLTPISDGNSATDDSGRANTNINAVSFKSQSLTTIGDYQFTSYYGADGKLIIGRRDLAADPTTWTLNRTQFTSFNINDSHNTSSIAIDGDGYLHVAWGVHGNPLLYTRSTTSVLSGDPFNFIGDTIGNSGSLTGALPFQSSGTTYPEFYHLPGSGDLLLSYRTGSSGNGEYQLARWNNSTNAWTSVRTALNSGNSGAQPWIDNDYSGDALPNVNAYHNKLVIEGSGRMHVSWSWRTGSDSTTGFTDYQSNHNIMYAYSDNGGVDWYRDNGERYQRNDVHDIDENNAIPVINIPEGSSLRNQVGSTVGPDGHYYIGHTWAPNAAQGNHLRQYMLVEYDGVQWKTHQVGQRDPEYSNNRIPESLLNDYSMRRPIVLSDEGNRIFLVFSDYQRGGGVTVGQSAARDDWQFIDLTTENMDRWDPTYDLNRWQQDGVLSMFYLPGGPTAGIASVLEWDARAYFYSLDPVAGDFDVDGDVDGEDFAVWQTNFPMAGGATLADGDADGDGDVDGADFVVWQTNFSITSGPAAAAVPESPSLLLAMLGGLTLIGGVKHRGRGRNRSTD